MTCEVKCYTWLKWCDFRGSRPSDHSQSILPQVARFMGPTWGPPGSCRSQMGPMLAPWTLLSGRSIDWNREASELKKPLNKTFFNFSQPSRDVLHLIALEMFLHFRLCTARKVCCIHYVCNHLEKRLFFYESHDPLVIVPVNQSVIILWHLRCRRCPLKRNLPGLFLCRGYLTVAGWKSALKGYFIAGHHI